MYRCNSSVIVVYPNRASLNYVAIIRVLDGTYDNVKFKRQYFADIILKTSVLLLLTRILLMYVKERMNVWMNDCCFRSRFCTVKAILGQGQPGLMRWILLWIMLLVKIDRSTCWPAVQRDSTVPRTPLLIELQCSIFQYRDVLLKGQK